MKNKTLEQLKEETKQLSKKDIAQMVKWKLELVSLRRDNPFMNYPGKMYRKLNSEYWVMDISLDCLMDLPEDMLLRQYEHTSRKPLMKEDVCKCVWVMDYMDYYTSYPEHRFRTMEDLMDNDFHVLYDNYNHLLEKLEQLELIFERKFEVNYKDYHELVKYYNKLERTGEARRYRLEMARLHSENMEAAKDKF